MSFPFIMLLLVFPFAQNAQTADDLTIQVSPAPQQSHSPELEKANKLTAEVMKLTGEKKYDEALPLAKRAIELRESALGKDHELVVSALNNLAEVYIETAEYPEAEPLLRRSLGTLEKRFGPDSTFLVYTLERLSLVRFARRDGSEAERLLSRALAIRQKALGPEHIEVARSLTQLGNLYDKLGKPGKAAEYYKESLPIIQKALGPSHLELAEALYLCACALLHDNKIDEGKQYQERERAIRGPNAPEPINRGVIQGSAILRAEPSYPIEARRARVSGSVVVQVTVDECGIVIKTRPLSGPADLRPDAEAAARKWRFSPTRVAGRPVKVIGTITFNFRM